MHIKNFQPVKTILYSTVLTRENQVVLEHLANNGQVKPLECQVLWWKKLEWTLLSEMNLQMTMQRITERRDPYG